MIPERWRRGEAAVIGLARSGAAASRWLAANGLPVVPWVVLRSHDLAGAGVALPYFGAAPDQGAYQHP